MEYTKFKCEIYRVDIYLSFSESIVEAERQLKRRAGFGYDDITEDWGAGYIQQGSRFAMLLMPSKNLLRNIHHETIHITMAILNRIGVPHTSETDEAFCYLSDWIFDKTVSFLKKKGVQF